MEPIGKRIRELAPDDISLMEAEGLMQPSRWRELNRKAPLLWGACQGKWTYQAVVDLNTLDYQCSCPSSKSPCRHVLGLLLLADSSLAAISEHECPGWVASWVDQRQSTLAAEAETQARKPADQHAQQQRQRQRQAKILAGLDRLDLWLNDLIRNGLAGLERQPADYWEEVAKRLVDAQAPGLAGRIRRLAFIPDSSLDWPSRILSELGRLKLLVLSYRNIDALPAQLQLDVRQQIGWNLSQQELEEAGELVDDEWACFGQWEDDDDRLRTQRSWAVGMKSGRISLLLQFAPGMRGYPESISAGSILPASLRFYPGACPVRVRLHERQGPERPITAPLPGLNSFSELLEQWAGQLGLNPWQRSRGVVLRGVSLVPGSPDWHLRDRDGLALPLTGTDHWSVLAHSGGHPCDIGGEWNGESLRLLGYFFEGRYHLR